MKKKLLTYAVSLCFLAGAIALPVAQTFGDNFSVSAESVRSGATFSAQDSFKVSKTFSSMPLTVEATVILPSSVSGRGGVILGNYGGATQCLNFEVSNGGVPRLYYNDGSTLADLKFSQVSIAKNTVLHVAYVMDFENSQAKFFLDGELKQTLALTNTQVDALSSKMMIGGDLRSGNDVFFKGTMYDLTVYSDVRTDEEIAEDANPHSKRGDNLLAFYEFVGQIGNTLVDNSGNGYDAHRNITWISSNEVYDYSYAFAVVGDTQIVNSRDPKNYPLIYQWLADNAKAKKIKFVMGLGDITDKDAEDEWNRAVESFQLLETVVPHSQVRGNHDSHGNFINYMSYPEYVNSFTGAYEDSVENNYRTLKVGQLQYLIFCLDYGANDDVLEWAGQVCDEYPNHNVIITTHAYLFRDGTTLDQKDVCPPATSGGANNGDHMWEKLVSKHKNITMVLSGHDPCDTIVVSQDKGEHGNTVTQMLIDPQSIDVSTSTGMIAMLYFSRDGKNVQVEWYSPIQDKFYRAENQFTMTVDVVKAAQTSDDPTTSESTGGFSLSCKSFTGAEGLISIAVVACAIAKSKKED